MAVKYLGLKLGLVSGSVAAVVAGAAFLRSQVPPTEAEALVPAAENATAAATVGPPSKPAAAATTTATTARATATAAPRTAKRTRAS